MKSPTIEKRFSESWTPEPYSGCWLWTKGTRSFGYGNFFVKSPDLHQAAHRVSWEIYRGEIPEELCVLHRCDTPSCVNPDHLFLGTRRENSADMARKKRSTIGSRNPNSKLTEADVLAIRSSLESHSKIAKKYGVLFGNIKDIRRGRTWKHCGGNTSLRVNPKARKKVKT